MKEDITETKLVSSHGDIDWYINEYMKVGWFIIETWVSGHGYPPEKNEQLNVLLGWKHSDKKPIHPNFEKLRSEMHDKGW